MGNDQRGTLFSVFHALEYINQARKAPKINTSLRLVKDQKAGALSGQNGCNLDAFAFPAGKAGVYLAVSVILGAQAHLS